MRERGGREMAKESRKYGQDCRGRAESNHDNGIVTIELT